MRIRGPARENRRRVSSVSSSGGDIFEIEEDRPDFRHEQSQGQHVGEESESDGQGSLAARKHLPLMLRYRKPGLRHAFSSLSGIARRNGQ